MVMKFEPGTEVDILYNGAWVGPFTVTAHEGRTPDHLVLQGPRGRLFEHHNDAPFNIRIHERGV
jgi:hypothetical protein